MNVIVDGRNKSMQHLNVGDNVLVGDQYQPVHLFTHRIKDGYAQFITVHTDCEQEITISPGHYLYVNDVLQPAKAIDIGDYLTHYQGNRCTVTKLALEYHRGIYNPHTLGGEIVVNGYRASVYTEALYVYSAHAALLPLRALWNSLRWTTNCLNHGLDHSLAWHQ